MYYRDEILVVNTEFNVPAKNSVDFRATLHRFPKILINIVHLGEDC